MITLFAGQNGDIFTTGYYESENLDVGGESLLVNQGNRDLFIVRYDSNGDHIWSLSAGGPCDDEGSDLALSPDGTYLYLGGNFRSSSITFGDISLNNQSPGSETSDFLVVTMLADNGNPVAAYGAGGSHDETHCSLDVAADGNVYLSVSTKSPLLNLGGGYLVNTYSGDDGNHILMAGLTSDLTHRWSAVFGGDQSESVYSALHSSGAFLISGVNSSTSLEFGGDPVINSNGKGEADIYVVKFQPVAEQ